MRPTFKNLHQTRLHQKFIQNSFLGVSNRHELWNQSISNIIGWVAGLLGRSDGPILQAKFFSQLFSLFYKLKKVHSNYLSTLWKAQRPSHQLTVLFPIYQIMIGPSDDWTIDWFLNYTTDQNQTKFFYCYI